MIEISELRKKLAAVANHALPVWDFYDWLDEASIDMHLDSDQDAIQLVGAIRHVFAEYDRGLFDRRRLLGKLAGLQQHVVVAQSDGSSIVSISPARWISEPEEPWLELAVGDPQPL